MARNLNSEKTTTSSGNEQQDGNVKSRWRKVEALPGPKGMPIIGNMIQLRALQFHSAVENWAREFGPFCRFHLGSRPVLIVSDNEVITKLLRDRPDALRRSSRSSNMLIELGTSGLLTDEGDEWRNARKLVMRALTPDVIRRFFPTMVSMTERLHRRWRNAVLAGKPIDVLRDLKAYTLDVAIGLAMGQDINTLENPENPLQRDIENIFFRVSRRVSFPFPYWRYFKLPVDRAADASAKRIGEAVRDFIAKTRNELEANPDRRANPENMLEALIVARDEKGSEFTDEHVIGNAVTMVFAGEDTTSNAMAWLLNFVSRHPQVGTKLSREADASLIEQVVLQDFKKLDQFPYIDAAANESMRLKPVLPIISLETNKEMTIGDIQAPQGLLMMVCLRYASQLAHDFNEPDVFLPERWLDEEHSMASDDPKRTLFTFGGGPRFCPGRYLAMAEMKMVMSMIARNFTLSYDKDAPPIKELFAFTMTPSSLPIKFSLRNEG